MYRYRVVVGWMLVIGVVAACAPATPTAAPSRTALVSELRNAVELHAADSTDWQAAAEGQTLAAGGGVRTGENARARVDISDGTILRLTANTEFELTTLSPEADNPVTKWTLNAGHIFIQVTKALGVGSFEVDTPNGVATVRGSLMGVEYHPANAHMIITCLEGECTLTQPATGQSTTLTAGQQTGIRGLGNDPRPAGTIDSVRLGEWAQFFPEVLTIVTTITPGPPPTATLVFTPTP